MLKSLSLSLAISLSCVCKSHHNPVLFSFSLTHTQNKVCHLALQNTPTPSCWVPRYCKSPTFLVWCQRCQWYRINYIDKYSIKFWTITVTLNTAIQSFQKTLQLMMMHNQTKFGCKRIGSSEDIAETTRFWLHEPWWYQNNLFTRHWCITIHLGTKGSIVPKISARQTLNEVLNHSCDLEQWSYLLTRVMMYHQTKFGSKRIGSLEDKNGQI